MATTRIIPMHINKGKTIAQCMTARLDYVKNPDKTAGGELISSYACAPRTADREFLLSRDAYLANTGRHISYGITRYNIVCQYSIRAAALLNPGGAIAQF